MIKDTQQKIKAIRYCVALGFVPHMEVVVRYVADTGASPCDLTDIDVVGIRPGSVAPAARIIFDCKTLAKISPINRAFWAKGLMDVTGSSEAFVILAKPAIEAHRLAGNSFGVRLFSQDLFDKYAASASSDYMVKNSYIEDLSGWEKLNDARRNYPSLEGLLGFLGASAWLQSNGAQGLRTLMSHMRQSASEMDPGKAAHRAIFIMAMSQFSLYVSEMVRDFHNIFDPGADRAQFERTLRYYVWGGKDNYDLRQRLHAAVKTAKGVSDIEPFEFPGWDGFVEYFRGCLDSPLSVSATCLPLKDMAFRELVIPIPDVDRRISSRLKANNRVRQFALSAASYFSEASRVPRDFREMFSKELNILLENS